MYRSLVTFVVFCLYALAFTSSGPILYAVDVGDESGWILLKKYSEMRKQSCQYFYKSISTDENLVLRYHSGKWEITKGATHSKSNGGCFLGSGSGTQLFTHEGKDMSNGTWFNVQEGNNVPNFGIYAIEDCTTYKGAFIDADFKPGIKTMGSRDPLDCPAEANQSGQDIQSGVILFTTVTQIRSAWTFESEPWRKIVCKFQNIESLSKAYLRLNETDENSSVLVGGSRCKVRKKGRSAKIVNISEALLNNSNPDYESLEDTEESTFLIWIYIGVGVGAGAVAALMILVLISFCCCRKKNKGGKVRKVDGNYGQASIDNNLQYGEDKEYYQYQDDKKQTRLVDANEMYTSYDYQ